MQKSRTVQIDKSEVDFMVLEYSSRDSSVLSSLGKHCKESHWKLSVGAESTPISIDLTVDKQVALSPEVSLIWNGEKVFPADNRTKAKLTEELRYTMPFRGTLKGLAVKDYFEVRPEHLGREQWFLATLTEQREDGLFKAILQMPDGKGGFNAIDYPAVKVENVREAAANKRAAVLPKRILHILVPVRDPLHAVLCIDNEPVTHFFARLTPPPSLQENNSAVVGTGGKSRINFSVSKDRFKVTANAGHSVLQQFLSGEIRGITQQADSLKHTWTFQVGPHALHKVDIEKRYASSSLFSLFVDDTLLAESNAEDIESSPGRWECSFRLVGERFMDWEVFENDVDGNSLDSTGVVTHRTKFSHEVSVSFEESQRYLTAAKLYIDGVDFVDLPPARTQLSNEEPVSCSTQALTGSYGLTVPYRVNETRREAGALFTNGFSPLASARSDAGPLGFMFTCCSSPAIGKDFPH